MIDLDAYLARIDYAGERAATPDVLRAVHRLHAQAIPFENLNPMLRWPVALDAASLEAKLVHGGRGGFCFEHNLLLRHALDALGFRTAGLAARVRWNVPPDAVTPRGHMLLRVEAEGEAYVADVGFGGLTLTAPLRLAADVEQPTPHEPFRLRDDGGTLVMEAKVAERWAPLYRFDLVEQAQVDYEVTSWYLTHHPNSPFVNNLMAARTEPGRRYALRNGELAIHRAGGATERRALGDPAELREVLEDVFLVRVPDAPEVDALFERLTRRESAAVPA